MENKMQGHADLGLIITALGQKGWGCIGGYSTENAVALVMFDYRVWGYAKLIAAGETWPDLPQEPADLWRLAKEGIGALNETCRRLGLPPYLPGIQVEATACLRELYPIHKCGRPGPVPGQ